MKSKLGCLDTGFVTIKSMASNAAIRGSILAVPDACFVMMMALPLGSTRLPPMPWCPEPLDGTQIAAADKVLFESKLSAKFSSEIRFHGWSCSLGRCGQAQARSPDRRHRHFSHEPQQSFPRRAF